MNLVYFSCLSFFNKTFSYLSKKMRIIIIKFIFAFFVVKIVFNNIILSCRYDREESNTMSDADTSSLFLGDEASFQKKEAEVAKKMVCCNHL